MQCQTEYSIPERVDIDSKRWHIVVGKTTSDAVENLQSEGLMLRRIPSMRPPSPSTRPQQQ